jgi:quinoprotein glucose dehydrogenase
MKRSRVILLALAGLTLGVTLTPLTNKIAFRIGKTSAQWERRQSIIKFETRKLSEDFAVELVAEGFTCPWDMAWAPDGRLFVADRGGEVYIIDAATGTKRLYHRVADVLNHAHTLHSGLFDIEFHPDFEHNRFVYLYSSFSDLTLLPNPSAELSIQSGDWGLRNKVVRYRDTGEGLVFDRVIFVSDHGARTRSSGGRLRFGPDGMLYISSPFATTWQAPQDLANTLGKMLRVTPDGDIPSDNPFVHQSGARGEIWTRGHKNIYGFDWLPDSNELLSIEHGPTGEHVSVRGYDEMNLLRPGANYGFPLVWGEWTAPGVTPPLQYWPHGHPPGDLFIYRGDAFPSWKGDCFISHMGNSSLHRLRIRDGRVIEDEILLQWIPDPWSPFHVGLDSRPRTRTGRVRAVKQGPDGFLYVSTDRRLSKSGTDAIYRLRPR